MHQCSNLHSRKAALCSGKISQFYDKMKIMSPDWQLLGTWHTILCVWDVNICIEPTNIFTLRKWRYSNGFCSEKYVEINNFKYIMHEVIVQKVLIKSPSEKLDTFPVTGFSLTWKCLNEKENNGIIWLYWNWLEGGMVVQWLALSPHSKKPPPTVQRHAPTLGVYQLATCLGCTLPLALSHPSLILIHPDED